MSFLANFRDRRFLPTATAFVSAASLIAEVTLVAAPPSNVRIGLLGTFFGNRSGSANTLLIRDGAGGRTLLSLFAGANVQNNNQPAGAIELVPGNPLVFIATAEAAASGWADIGVEYILIG